MKHTAQIAVQRILPGDPAGEALFRSAFSALIEPYWPDLAGERNADFYLDLLNGQSEKAAIATPLLLVATEPVTGEIVGVRVAEYFHRSHTVYANLIRVHPDHEGKGIWKKLMDETARSFHEMEKQYGPIRGWFLDAENPAMNEPDPNAQTAADERIAMFERSGFKRALKSGRPDQAFRYESLESVDGETDPTYLLMSAPYKGATAAAKPAIIAGFLQDMFDLFSSPSQQEQVALDRMLDELSRRSTIRDRALHLRGSAHMLQTIAGELWEKPQLLVQLLQDEAARERFLVERNRFVEKTRPDISANYDDTRGSIEALLAQALCSAAEVSRHIPPL